MSYHSLVVVSLYYTNKRLLQPGPQSACIGTCYALTEHFRSISIIGMVTLGVAFEILTVSHKALWISGPSYYMTVSSAPTLDI